MKNGYILNLSRTDFVSLGKYSKEYQMSKPVNAILENVVNNHQYIDGTKIQDDWFPEVDANVFISHSGKDGELAIKLANYLNKEFGVKSFVDSQVWGYYPNLMKMLDNGRDTKNNKVILSKYDECSAHVHNMLSIALAKMIQKCDYFIFIDTDNSRDCFSNMTVSPWIYFELSLSYMFAPKDGMVQEGLEFFSNIAYKAPTKHLKPIDINDFSAIFESNRIVNEELKHFQHLTDYLKR